MCCLQDGVSSIGPIAVLCRKFIEQFVVKSDIGLQELQTGLKETEMNTAE